MLEINPSSARPELNALEIRNNRGANTRPAQNMPPDRASDQDQVELSASAQEQQAAAQAAADERLADLRASITDGTYLTPEKVDYVVDRLREELFGRSDAA